MKKYTQPTTTIIEIENEKLLDDSPGINNAKGNNNSWFANERDSFDDNPDDDEDLW